MTLQELIAALGDGAVDFNEVMAVIDENYTFTPTRFTNGDTVNEAGTNNGSCKVFSFAMLNGLDKQSTLNAFGDFYTKDVLQNPQAQDHMNIRNFMQHGWEGIEFEGAALQKK